MYCSHCGNEVKDDAVVCMSCGCRVVRATNTDIVPENDTNHTGLNVLSFFFPVVGLILYFVWHDEYPVKAKGVGKWALISFILCVVVCIIIFVVLIASTFAWFN